MEKRMKCRKPVICVLVIYIVCFAARIFEYFVMRTDQTFWGEAFIHKLFGIAVMILIVKMLSMRMSDIGFGRKDALKETLAGLAFGLVVFAVAYGVEILITVIQGNFQGLRFYVSAYAVDRNVGNQTAFIFFIICIVDNIINVVMEEGIFRGLFQKMLQWKNPFMGAAIMTSVLFALWHTMGPVRNYTDGTSSMNGMIMNCLMLAITSGLVGFKFALMNRMTGSLYMEMGDHLVNNAIVNLLHVVSDSGADELMFVRITVAQSLSFLIVLIWYLRSFPKASRNPNRFL